MGPVLTGSCLPGGPGGAERPERRPPRAASAARLSTPPFGVGFGPGRKPAVRGRASERDDEENFAVTVRVGINGFGRIGRNFWRAGAAGGGASAVLEIVAANELGDSA